MIYVHRTTPHPFDHILAIPEFGIDTVTYDYYTGRNAGTDHGVVSATLTS